MADITTQVLIEIRDEARKTNERLDWTNERLDGLERRQDETESRLSTRLVEVVGTLHAFQDRVLEELRLAAQLGDHERPIAALEASRTNG